MNSDATPRELFLDAVSGRRRGRAAVASPTSIVTVELQDLIGVYFPEAHHDPRAMAKLALAGRTVCGYDTVFPVFGAGTHEAEALGVPVRWGEKGRLPAVAGSIWRDPAEIVVPDDFAERPSVATVLEAIRILRAEVGEEVAIIGKVYGPWSLAYHTFGLQNFLKDTIRNPQKVHEILHRLKQVPLVFAELQIEAGVDALTWGDHITADLIRPEAYPTFLGDIHRELSARIEAPLILHCCGKTLDRIAYFNESGMACFHFESANDAREMRSKSKMALAGNVNNLRTLFQGTPEDVRREVFYALDAGVDIIAPECAIPLDAKLANVIAVRDSVDAYYANDH
jgi:[methyl-Co(III) methanol-specific corrinoid protein]:coenzyme M methyltransferase